MTDTPQPPQLPPARVRVRRQLHVDDAPVRMRQRPEPPRRQRTDEHDAFEYASTGLGDSIGVRYRRIKDVEGRAAAKEWAKTQIMRLMFSGVPTRDIAAQFMFSVDWTRELIDECRNDMRREKVSGYDASSLIAEHLSIYGMVRENAFFTMQRQTGITEVDKHRARESLLATMRQEVEFVEKMGGLRGLTLTAVQDDEATVAAKQMGDRLKTIMDQFSALDEELLDAPETDDAPPPPPPEGDEEEEDEVEAS